MTRERGRAGAAIEARAVGYTHPGRRGDRRGVEGIDLTVMPGAIEGVLGPNGAGKSTLMGVLMTRVAPERGELRLLGADARTAGPALRRRLGCAPDEPVHVAQLTGIENAVLFGRAAGLTDASARAAALPLLERFGLAGDADRRVADYSLGMRRKLLLCEALIATPAVLLLDEPTLGLDAPSREALAEELKASSAAGAAIVIATNDLALAGESCDHVLFLREGRIALEGEPATLLGCVGTGTWIEVGYSAPRTPRVERPDIELVEATDHVLRFRSRAGSAPLPALCAALLECGCDIRSVQIREPDLRDVFNAATGEAWAPAAAAAS